MPSESESTFVHSLSAKEIETHNQFLSDVGPRFVGTDAEIKAMSYVADRFSAYGLELVSDDFQALAFEPRAVEFSLTSPVDMDLEAGAIFFSDSTPGLTGELAFAGNGDDADYEVVDVRGKIAVIETDVNAPKGALYQDICRASRNGAIAVVFVHYEPRLQILMAETGYFGLEKRLLPIEPKPIPAVCTRSDHWHRAVRLATGRPMFARIKVDAVCEQRTTSNIRGILKGTDRPERKILLIAHRDTVSSPGVSDNGSGQVILLEIARILSQSPPRRTVEFVSLGAGEVLGCVGSWTYVEQHRDDLAGIDAVINLDAVGMGAHLRIVTEGYWADFGPMKTTDWLNEAIAQSAADLNYSISSTPCILGLSDATPFLHAGVPAAWLWKYDDPYWHSLLDDAGHVDPNAIKVTAEIVGLTALRLANKE